MELFLKPGKYVIAVSGGVDSMALLAMLAGKPGLDLIVAHFDHGVRPDSKKDRVMVGKTAKRYNLPFAYAEGKLGANASEDTARKSRYDFLREVRQQHHASAIITAHHQDDVLETMLINLIRGTGRKGLSSLQTTAELLRPLLDVPKATLRQYAISHGIVWHEDSTNRSADYLRNHLRQYILPHMKPTERAQLLAIYKAMISLNKEIDAEVTETLAHVAGTQARICVRRSQFILLPHAVAREVMAHWLRTESVHNIDRKQIERLVVAVKIGRAGTTYDVDKRRIMDIGRTLAEITPRHARKTSA
jgi:tRNA(Ile)-lysidine synthase